MFIVILCFAQALFTLGSAHTESQQTTFAVMASNGLMILCMIFLQISTLECNTVSKRGEKLCFKPVSNCCTLLKLFSTVLIYFISYIYSQTTSQETQLCIEHYKYRLLFIFYFSLRNHCQLLSYHTNQSAFHFEHFLVQGLFGGVLAATFCFPTSAKVSLENGTSQTISQLQNGDRVQTGSLNFFRN